MKSNTFQNNLQHQFLYKMFPGSKVSSGYQPCENGVWWPDILETISNINPRQRTQKQSMKRMILLSLWHGLSSKNISLHSVTMKTSDYTII